MTTIIDNYTKEELQNIVNTSKSYQEILIKLGYTSINSSNKATLKARLNAHNIRTEHLDEKKQEIRTEENIFIENSTASQATLRRWYAKEKYSEYKCSICGLLPVWQDKELTLILDHINGVNHDNRLENLRWVCPNCNQQLETTGFKHERAQVMQKIQKKYFCSNCGMEITRYASTGMCYNCYIKTTRMCERPTREELKKLIRTLPFTHIGKQFGVSDKAITKWCISMNLPSKKKDINIYSNEEWEKI